MPSSYDNDDSEFEDELLIEALNDNCNRRYVVDINYNRPLKKFPSTLNKIEEVDEISSKSEDSDRKEDENGNPIEESKSGKNVMWNPEPEVIQITNRNKTKQRPKSANYAVDMCKVEDENKQKRPKSSCANYPSRIPVKKSQVKAKSDSDTSSGLSIGAENDKIPTGKREYSSCEHLHVDEFERAWDAYPERSTSACCMRPPEHYDNRYFRTARSNSQPNISRRRNKTTYPQAWCEVSRYKRSLRLLGLSNSDFGLPDSPKERDQLPPRPRSSYNVSAPTFYTKVLERSISLESLREIIRESSKENYSGLPQRRLLAQAAYEEWYFKKTSEFNKVQKKQREKIVEQKEKLEEDASRRRGKAGEKFQEWLESKRSQEKEKKVKKLKLDENLDKRLIKSKEDIDKAYLEWKKKKQKDLDKKKQAKIEQTEREEREMSQKEEKKRLAEKVFLEWKRKLEETEKEKKEKERAAKEKLRDVITSRSTKTNTSFKVWKDMKDGEIREKWKSIRLTAKKAAAARNMQVTERLYEAEQAFEDWLDKVDTRKQKEVHIKIKNAKATIPWTPA